MDMSAAYAKGVAMALPKAQISYDRCHVVSMAIEAMDEVRRVEMTEDAQAARAALGVTTARRSNNCCGACGATPLVGAAAKSVPCTGCSTPRSRVRGRGG
jgi:hypothetical protein